MKKILLILVLLLGLGGAGAGYYLFVMKPDMDKDAMESKETAVEDDASTDSTQTTSVPQSTRPMKRLMYANERRVDVKTMPSEDVFPERYLYKGDPVTVVEEKDGWGRISNYYLLKENGPQLAEWVKLTDMTDQLPIISKSEKEEILTSYVGLSDDFKDYREVFLNVTDKLLNEKMCTPEDLKETKGWMRSLNYPDRNVYFLYCGGLKLDDKIYLDVDSKETFY